MQSLRLLATSVAFFLFSYIAIAQNLIPNPGFEEFIECPDGLMQFSKIKHWKSANSGTPELYHLCGFSGNIAPRSGEGMAGLILHSDYNNASLEYIQAELTDSLKKEVSYCFSYYIRLDQESPIAINKIGAYFSKDRLYTPNWVQLKNRPQVFVKEVVDSKDSWKKIEGVYRAKGGERYVTVGNFFKSYYLEEKKVGNNWNNWMTYYYVDDFALYPAADCSSFVKVEEPPKREEIVWTHTVYFDKDIDKMSQQEEEALRVFLGQIPKPIFQPIKVEGHTDTDASLEYNLQLSQRRATEVQAYLLSKGMNNVYLSWAGEEKTLNDDLTLSEKALNRRVEIIIKKDE